MVGVFAHIISSHKADRERIPLLQLVVPLGGTICNVPMNHSESCTKKWARKLISRAFRLRDLAHRVFCKASRTYP